MTVLESKLNAAYAHGRMDFLAGAPCDPKTPLAVYSSLSDEDKKLIAKSWEEGWISESLM